MRRAHNPFVLVLVLAGCASSVDDHDACDLERPRVAVALPDGCWEATSCSTSTPADDTCGRAYVCPIEGHDECVIARDCACMEDFADACDDVEVPSYCALEEP